MSLESLTPESRSEPPASPPVLPAAPGRAPGLPFFKPPWMKKALALAKGVRKFVQYNRDLMMADKLARVRTLEAAYEAALRARDQAAAEALEKDLVASCEGAVPNYRSSAVKENIEVIVVAIVVALGIRAYFLQPFKIPTASMQPTLNGITAKAMPDTEKFPNFALRGLEYVARGRNYVEMRVPGDWPVVQLTGIRQRSMLHFFTVTDLVFRDASQKEHVLSGYVPARQLWESLWIGQRPMAEDAKAIMTGAERLNVRLHSGPIQPGTLLARGHVDTGDQVLVNKMAYHFRRPERGEVFVFGTSGITGIASPAGVDSQHYIKRLTGLPGDRLQLVPSDQTVVSASGKPGRVAALHVNGQPAQEAGMQRVMARENGYKGYTQTESGPGVYLHPDQEKALGSREYMAMGDNSPDSSDSRYWGPVPEQNLVGPALLVYWPFLPHFGLIR